VGALSESIFDRKERRSQEGEAATFPPRSPEDATFRPQPGIARNGGDFLPPMPWGGHHGDWPQSRSRTPE